MLSITRFPGAAMKISDLLSPTDVMIDVRASNKRLLLQELAAKAASNLGLDVDRVAPYLLQWEELGSTGIVNVGASGTLSSRASRALL
jgi:mannitol/fructose-specific phosphotransferase system IIA component (Ntr-type)